MSSPCAHAQARPAKVCAQDRVSFFVVPNQSLSAHGAYTLYSALSGAAAICQMSFLLRGSWPVTMLAVIDLLGTLFAIHIFRLCQRERKEEIVVEGGRVSIRRSALGRAVREVTLACYGLTLARSGDPDFGRRRLSLALRAKREDIARNLSLGERERFADALWDALRRHSVSLRCKSAFGWSLFTKRTLCAMRRQAEDRQ